MSIYNAKWICEKDGFDSPFFRKKFNVGNIKSAVLDICGLGWFEAYIDGKKISDAVLCPGASTYSQVDTKKANFRYPWQDTMTGTRAYFCRFDVSALLKNGENVLSVQLGNGYWNQIRRLGEGNFSNGAPILCFSLQLEYADGRTELVESDQSVLCGKSGILENNLYYGEVHDLSLDNIHSPDFDEKNMSAATIVKTPDFELCLWRADYDKVVRSITPIFIGEVDGKKVYDVGEDISGWIAFDTDTDSEVYLEFAEEICGDKSLNFRHTGWGNFGLDQVQSCRYIGDGKPHYDVHPHFSWQGFRYFTIEGKAENIRCDVVHTALTQTGDFVCDDKIINTILAMYKRSQLTNIHGCVPSDCPHRERLGYTGDGQITCETVMHMFDARGMYRKWMRDIVDGQNIKTGRVQNTAPFGGGGGGPCGWGGAIFVVPYMYCKMYGDADLAKEYAENMAFYFDYLETRCDDNLVARSEEGQWCLGDWCWPGCSAYSLDLPPKYVNTAYLVKFYDMMLELDKEFGLGFDREEYKRRRKIHADAVVKNFYDEKTGDFAGNRFGGNAFALDIGLGDERTFENLADKYDSFEGFDTGIFATEFLIRIFGERGRKDLVYKLLTSRKYNSSFYAMYDRGATTLWEDWDGHTSHNHPMFGGCFKAMWTGFLGINPTSAGYKSVKITPCDIKELGNMHGYMETYYGRLSVDAKRDGEKVKFTVFVPHGCTAEFEFRGKFEKLCGGVNVLKFDGEA